MKNLIKVHDGFPIDSLMASIANKPYLWELTTERQTTPGSPHVDTESIVLHGPVRRDIEAVFTDLETVVWLDIPAAEELIDLVMANTGSTELGRVMIVNLKPGGLITKHVDEGAYADHFERFHLVLESHKGNIFNVEDSDQAGEYVHMRTGELWWFNHKKPHTVLNQSLYPRLHMIVDCVAPAYRRERK